MSATNGSETVRDFGDEPCMNIDFTGLDKVYVVPDFQLIYFNKFLSERSSPRYVTLASDKDPISCVTSDVVKEGASECPVREHTNLSSVEKVFEVPEFRHPYSKRMHALSDQYNDEAHKWLETYGIDEMLGPNSWQRFVKHRTPELAGYVYLDTEPEDCLWVFKFVGWGFVSDTYLEDVWKSGNPIAAFETLLDHLLVLLWNDPDNERVLKFTGPFLHYEIFPIEETESAIEMFRSNLLHARNKSKSLMDIKLDPLASAFRDLWIEYCEHVTADCVTRLAAPIASNLTASLMEGYMQREEIILNDFNEYTILRRATVAMVPYVVCTDLFIARRKNPISLIPDNLFYGPEMQCLLVAASDMMAWMNDIYSFHKDVVSLGEPHNMVLLVCKRYNCASYTEAGAITLQLMEYSLGKMMRDFDNLKAVAPADIYPAIEIYRDTCLNWVCGAYEWHRNSERYNYSGIQTFDFSS